jgi:ankyrin repeat protein
MDLPTDILVYISQFLGTPSPIDRYKKHGYYQVHEFFKWLSLCHGTMGLPIPECLVKSIFVHGLTTRKFWIVEALLDRPSLQPAHQSLEYLQHNFLILYNPKTRSSPMLPILLQNPNFKPLPWLLSGFCLVGDAASVKLLLLDSRIDPSADNNSAIACAFHGEAWNVLELLLNEPRIDPANYGSLSLILAAHTGKWNVVKKLLNFKAVVDPSFLESMIFWKSVGAGQTEIVEQLLKDPRVNPTASANLALSVAAADGRLDLVEMLLSVDRVNPSDANNMALIDAAYEGHLSIVQRLLKDHRFRQTDRGHFALARAAAKGHILIVSCLLRDGRFSPSYLDNAALYNAVEYQRYGVAKLILLDPRVQAPHRALYRALQKQDEFMISLFLTSKAVDPSGELKEAWTTSTDGKRRGYSRLKRDVKR